LLTTPFALIEARMTYLLLVGSIFIIPPLAINLEPRAD